jgi:hypothetical protein
VIPHVFDEVIGCIDDSPAMNIIWLYLTILTVVKSHNTRKAMPFSQCRMSYVVSIVADLGESSLL